MKAVERKMLIWYTSVRWLKCAVLVESGLKNLVADVPTINARRQIKLLLTRVASSSGLKINVGDIFASVGAGSRYGLSTITSIRAYQSFYRAIGCREHVIELSKWLEQYLLMRLHSSLADMSVRLRTAISTAWVNATDVLFVQMKNRNALHGAGQHAGERFIETRQRGEQSGCVLKCWTLTEMPAHAAVKPKLSFLR